MRLHAQTRHQTAFVYLNIMVSTKDRFHNKEAKAFFKTSRNQQRARKLTPPQLPIPKRPPSARLKHHRSSTWSSKPQKEAPLICQVEFWLAFIVWLQVLVAFNALYWDTLIEVTCVLTEYLVVGRTGSVIIDEKSILRAKTLPCLFHLPTRFWARGGFFLTYRNFLITHHY